jgi:predicted DNA binding CopG/RHH family protein
MCRPAHKIKGKAKFRALYRKRKLNTIELDDYEQEILEAYEEGRLKPAPSDTDYQTVAQNTIKKNKKINIRISENDLERNMDFVPGPGFRTDSGLTAEEKGIKTPETGFAILVIGNKAFQCFPDDGINGRLFLGSQISGVFQEMVINFQGDVCHFRPHCSNGSLPWIL